MSLLSTFGILFETDAEKAKREVDELDESLSNTESTANNTADSFDELGGAVDESTDSFIGLGDGLGVAAAGLIAVTGLFAGLISNAAATDEIGKFSNAIGANVEDVGAWGEAVKRAGGDVDSFMGSLGSLTDQLTDIELTGGGEVSEIFARLGVDAVGAGGKIKSAFEVLPELADSFQKLSKTESFAFGKKLGLDQGTILLLQQGRVAVEEFVLKQKSLGVATKEDAAAAAEFNDALADSQQSFTHLFTTAGTTILPLLTTMMKGFDTVASWMGENKTLVTGFFIGIAGVLTAIYLPAIVSAASATLIAMAPFLLIGATIAALGVGFALLYEDVVAYIGGQESFIGDLAKKYEWFGKIVDAVAKAFKFAIKEVSEFSSEMFANMQSAVEFLGKIFNAVFGGISGAFTELSVDVGRIVDIIIAAFSLLGDAISGFLGFVASPIETTKELMSDLASGISGAFDGALDLVIKPKVSVDSDGADDSTNAIGLDSELSDKKETDDGTQKNVVNKIKTPTNEQQAQPKTKENISNIELIDPVIVPDVIGDIDLSENKVITPDIPAISVAIEPIKEISVDGIIDLSQQDVILPDIGPLFGVIEPVDAPIINGDIDLSENKVILPDVEDSFSGMESFFGIDNDEISANIDKAIKVTGAVDNNPLNGQTSASIVNSQQTSNRINNVKLGDTTVNTQATDADGVAAAIGDNMNNQVSMAIQQFDDAEAY